jgi:anti-repressor protein
LIRDYCKILNDRWITIWQNNLYKWLRENKYLMKDNRPYQAYAQYFSVKERLVKSLNGERLCLTTYLLWKWQEYFYNKLKLTLA